MTAPANTAEKAKHTPGKWFVGRALRHNARAIIGDGDTVVAILPGEWNDCTYVEPNARLIAAAPELLAALIALRDAGPNGSTGFEGWHPAYSDATRLCRAAIARATGATP